MNTFDSNNHQHLPAVSAGAGLWLSFADAYTRLCRQSDTGMVIGVYQEYGSSG